jgi:predicted amino acid-binding ACT domain protein
VNEVAVTAVGTDRPGIVAALTGALLEIGGNLEDARAALLRGSFATVLAVAVPDEIGPEQVEAALRPVAGGWGPPPPGARGRRWTAASCRSTAPTTPASSTGSAGRWPTGRRTWST